MASTIGIKIANGEFYSIVEENSPVKKRLVLTTVHDKQRSVQIDLYKSYTRTMADALYIGSLVVENIKPRPKGEPSIELIITSSKDGEISADAVDLDPSVKGEHQTLNVSLKSLDDDNREYEIPDFELEQSETPPIGLYEKASVVHQQEEEEEDRHLFPWLIVACAALILVAIGLSIWLVFFRTQNVPDTKSRPAQAAVQTQEPAAQPSNPQGAPTAQSTGPQPEKPAAQSPAQQAETPAANPNQAASEPPQAAPEPAKPQASPEPQVAAAQPPVIQAPVEAPASNTPGKRVRPAAPVTSYKVPFVIPKAGAPYKIRWGDTLWDISGAFYRNPWLYHRIARFNSIRNPDLIISGTTIRIPPRK